MGYPILLILIIAISFIRSEALSADIKLLYFYDPGCRWCEVMDDAMRDPSIVEVLERVDILRIDVRGREGVAGLNMTGRELAERYKVKGTPTVIFLNGDREVLRIPGAMTKKDFRELVCSHVIDSRECRLRGPALFERKRRVM